MSWVGLFVCAACDLRSVLIISRTLEGEIETVQGLSADLTQKLLQKAHSAC